MNQPQEIIIYRSPVEQQMYNYWLQPENFIFGITLMLVVVAVLVLAAWLYDKIRRKL